LSFESDDLSFMVPPRVWMMVDKTPLVATRPSVKAKLGGYGFSSV
jgi:hypothetical protein